MENMDQAQAARVWQRVRGNAPENEEITLQQLIDWEWEACQGYLHLSRRCGGRMSDALLRMSQEERSHCACLRGMLLLTGGKPGPLPNVAQSREPFEVILRGSYEKEMQSIRAYDERSADPTYGHVFRSMRDQEQAHSRTVLELLGTFDKK